MARRQTLANPENRQWKYILLLQDGGSYFGDTVWKLLKEIITHRWFDYKLWFKKNFRTLADEALTTFKEEIDTSMREKKNES